MLFNKSTTNTFLNKKRFQKPSIPTPNKNKRQKNQAPNPSPKSNNLTSKKSSLSHHEYIKKYQNASSNFNTINTLMLTNDTNSLKENKKSPNKRCKINISPSKNRIKNTKNSLKNALVSSSNYNKSINNDNFFNCFDNDCPFHNGFNGLDDMIMYSNNDNFFKENEECFMENSNGKDMFDLFKDSNFDSNFNYNNNINNNINGGSDSDYKYVNAFNNVFNMDNEINNKKVFDITPINSYDDKGKHDDVKINFDLTDFGLNNNNCQNINHFCSNKINNLYDNLNLNLSNSIINNQPNNYFGNENNLPTNFNIVNIRSNIFNNNICHLKNNDLQKPKKRIIKKKNNIIKKRAASAMITHKIRKSNTQNNDYMDNKINLQNSKFYDDPSFQKILIYLKVAKSLSLSSDLLRKNSMNSSSDKIFHIEKIRKEDKLREQLAVNENNNKEDSTSPKSSTKMSIQHIVNDIAVNNHPYQISLNQIKRTFLENCIILITTYNKSTNKFNKINPISLLKDDKNPQNTQINSLSPPKNPNSNTDNNQTTLNNPLINTQISIIKQAIALISECQFKYFPKELLENFCPDNKESRKRNKYFMFTPEAKNFCISLYKKEKIPLDFISKMCYVPSKSLKRWLIVGCIRKKGCGRKIKDPLMEEKLVSWYKMCINKGIYPTAKIIRRKALELSGNKEFLASKGWLEKFKKKYKIKSYTNREIKVFKGVKEIDKSGKGEEDKEIICADKEKKDNCDGLIGEIKRNGLKGIIVGNQIQNLRTTKKRKVLKTNFMVVKKGNSKLMFNKNADSSICVNRDFNKGKDNNDDVSLNSEKILELFK